MDLSPQPAEKVFLHPRFEGVWYVGRYVAVDTGMRTASIWTKRKFPWACTEF